MGAYDGYGPPQNPRDSRDARDYRAPTDYRDYPPQRARYEDDRYYRGPPPANPYSRGRSAQGLFFEASHVVALYRSPSILFCTWFQASGMPSFSLLRYMRKECKMLTCRTGVRFKSNSKSTGNSWQCSSSRCSPPAIGSRCQSLRSSSRLPSFCRRFIERLWPSASLSIAPSTSKLFSAFDPSGRNELARAATCFGFYRISTIRCWTAAQQR